MSSKHAMYMLFDKILILRKHVSKLFINFAVNFQNKSILFLKLYKTAIYCVWIAKILVSLFINKFSSQFYRTQFFL